jgi:hypothetical protein
MIYPYETWKFNEGTYKLLEMAREHRKFMRKNPGEQSQFDPTLMEKSLLEKSVKAKYEPILLDTKCLWEDFSTGAKPRRKETMNINGENSP